MKISKLLNYIIPGLACLVPYANERVCNTFMWKDWMMLPVCNEKEDND